MRYTLFSFHFVSSFLYFHLFVLCLFFVYIWTVFKGDNFILNCKQTENQLIHPWSPFTFFFSALWHFVTFSVLSFNATSIMFDCTVSFFVCQLWRKIECKFFICNIIMVSLLYAHVMRTVWKIRPQPKTAILKRKKIQKIQRFFLSFVLSWLLFVCLFVCLFCLFVLLCLLVGLFVGLFVVLFCFFFFFFFALFCCYCCWFFVCFVFLFVWFFLGFFLRERERESRVKVVFVFTVSRQSNVCSWAWLPNAQLCMPMCQICKCVYLHLRKYVVFDVTHPQVFVVVVVGGGGFWGGGGFVCLFVCLFVFKCIMLLCQSLSFVRSYKLDDFISAWSLSSSMSCWEWAHCQNWAYFCNQSVRLKSLLSSCSPFYLPPFPVNLSWDRWYSWLSFKHQSVVDFCQKNIYLFEFVNSGWQWPSLWIKVSTVQFQVTPVRSSCKRSFLLSKFTSFCQRSLPLAKGHFLLSKVTSSCQRSCPARPFPVPGWGPPPAWRTRRRAGTTTP